MWDAFTPHAVSVEKHRIQAVTSYANKFIVGTYYGALLLYSVTRSKADESFKAGLDRTVDKFSKKLIEQLAVIEDVETLLCLTDGSIALYNLHTLDLKSRLLKSRGAHLLATYTAPEDVPEHSVSSSNAPDHVYLATAVKKKLQLYVWNGTSFTDDPKEFTVPDRIQTMVFLSHLKICIGFTSGYAMLDTSDGSISELVLPSQVTAANGNPATSSLSSVAGYIGMGSKTTKPIITKLPNNELLLARDNNAFFLGVRGQKTRDKPMLWEHPPDDVSYFDPFIVGISSKQVEVRSLKTRALVQTILLEHTLKSIEGDVTPYITGNNNFWALEMLAFDEQVDLLVQKKSFDEAISLLEHLEDKDAESKTDAIARIRRLQALSLFENGQFDDAITIFLDLGTSPQAVISLYPSSVSGEEPLKKEPEESTLSSPKPDTTSTDASTEPDPTPLANDKAELEISNTDPSKASSDSHSEILTGERLTKAVGALIRYLTDRRHKISKAILHQNTSMASPLFLASTSPIPSSPRGSDRFSRSPLAAIRQQAEPSLHSTKDSILLNELASLGGEELQKMLQIVDTCLLRCYLLTNEKLATYLVRVQNAIDLDVGEKLLTERNKTKELVDLYHRRDMHRKALDLLQKLSTDTSSPMAGVEPTIRYLQRLGQDHLGLILDFSTWVLKEDPDRGIEIFTDDIPEVETLARDRVVTHLEKQSSSLAIRYLEHIINELGDASPEFHTKLALDRIEQAKQGGADESAKLLKFLETSTQYQPERLLNRLPKDSLYDSRAQILSRLGRHDQALIIYVCRLKDPAKAEAYCNKMYNSKDPVTRLIYLSLLRVLLQPTIEGESKAEPLLDSAIGLLARHGAQIDAAEVIKVIPEDLKIQDLYTFYEKQIREVHRVANMNRIVKHLMQADQVHVQESLMYYRSRRVKITDDRMCPHCAKRIGNSVFAIMPDGAVVHYGCKDPWSDTHKQYYESFV